MELLSSEILGGQIDTLVLYILNKGDSYGLDICNQLRELLQQRVELKETTLYSCYKRLESKDLITSYWGDETNGARRKYYTITVHGKVKLQENVRTWKDLFEMLLSIYSTIKED